MDFLDHKLDKEFTPVLKNRMTVINQVYHEHEGDITPVDVRYDMNIETPEDAYIRRFTPKLCWEPLNLGHVSDNPGFVLIENILPTYQIEPTPEKRELDLSKTIYIYLGTEINLEDAIPIDPGQCQSFRVPVSAAIQIRALKEDTRCRVYAFPK